MERIHVGSTTVQRDWRTIQRHIAQGQEVVVDHYGEPVALIVPYPGDDARRDEATTSD